MTTPHSEIFTKALQLDESGRAALAGMLIDSIDSHLEVAWMIEIERRIAELDSATVETIPWDIVRDGLHRHLGA